MLREVTAVVFIPLTRGKVATIDFEDFEKVRPYKWHAVKMQARWYAMHRFGKHGHCMPMHRFILDAPEGCQVDHEDGDGLMNRRYNIRLCSRSQNQQAKQRKRAGSTSQFRGVSWYSRDSVWVAQICKNGTWFYLGRYRDEEDAARAYDAAARKYFGEFASPNFP